MDEADKAMQSDIARLLSRRAEFVRVPCPGCGSEDSLPLFSKNGFHYEQCGGCETFYVNPRPSPQVLEWFYGNSATYDYWNANVFPAAEAARRKLIASPRVDRLLALCDRLGVAPESLLEVGAAFGTFCVEAASRGRFKRVVALEPTPGLARTCREHGLETIEQPFESYCAAAPSDRFSVLASFEVIEHLFAPRDFLQAAHRLLSPGGILVLTCPNGRGFDIQVLGAHSDTVDHEHLNYFSPASLGKLLADCGFEVIETSTPGRLDAELVRKKALAGFKLPADGFLQRVLIDEWDRLGAAFQEFLSGNGLSSHMWVVARNQHV
jgi:2-polyprenyl-3-methyl-5-hydroxy-6-metoxy-1,4-benzoquinol methylase/ribosomal protein S27E